MTQEVFVSVHENLGRFREDSKLSTWIFRICKNQCLNRIKYLRRRGRGLSEGLDMLTDADWLAMGGGPPRPDEALAAAREQALVQRAIAQLEDEHRLLVVLRDIEGLSYDEIVEVTDLPEGTVKSRLHRAREQLGRLLGAERDAEARRSAT